MQFLRAVGRQLSIFGFRSLVVLLPSVIALVVLFGTPTALKHALSNSGAYESIVPAILDQSAALEKSEDKEGQALFRDADLRAAVIKSVPSNTVEKSSETIIDATYAWLSGKTEQPTFSIDLTETKNQLTSNLAAYAEKRASGLQPCTAAQVRQLSTDQSILDLPCLPPGIDIREASKQFGSQALDNARVLTDPVVTADDLPKRPDGQPLYVGAAQAPDVFRWFNRAPFVFAVAALLFAAVHVLLHDVRRAGLRKIGWTLFGVGIFWLIGVALYALLFARVRNLESSEAIANTAFREAMNASFIYIADGFNRIVAICAATYTVLGAAMLLLVRHFMPEPEKTLAQTPEPTGTAPPAIQESITKENDNNKENKL